MAQTSEHTGKKIKLATANLKEAIETTVICGDHTKHLTILVEPSLHCQQLHYEQVCNPTLTTPYKPPGVRQRYD